MLFIVRKDKNGKKDERTWHLGGKKPADVIPLKDYLGNPYQEIADFDDVILVQADGHELDFIKNHFIGVPMRLSFGVMVWKGEMAQFIYDHFG